MGSSLFLSLISTILYIAIPIAGCFILYFAIVGNTKIVLKILLGVLIGIFIVPILFLMGCAALLGGK